MTKLHRQWTLKEWLADLEVRNIQEIQLGLTRITKVAATLCLLKPACPVITVAGTNGKGSTVGALEQIYHTAGYKVAAYTSPHLIAFNERVRFNLRAISDVDLCTIFSVIEEARGEVVLTYFEMTTLAALYYFKQESPDVIILEVGLGGRLDATNIIDADLAIITTIDYDHQDFLGNTLEAIGYEKSGILRQEKPLIYADYNPPSTIVSIAAQKAVPTYIFAQDYWINEKEDNWALFYSDGQISNLPKPKIQLKSAAAAVFASKLLEHQLPLRQSDINDAMQKIFIPGRLQLEVGDINILYDVSHNAQSVQLLAHTLSQMRGNTKIHAVFSALKDKDITGLIEPLKDCIDYWYPAQLEVKRAVSSDLLLSKFAKAEISVKICYNSPLLALNAALAQAQSGDLIVVYGSFFTVGYVLTANSDRRFYEIGNG